MSQDEEANTFELVGFIDVYMTSLVCPVKEATRRSFVMSQIAQDWSPLLVMILSAVANRQQETYPSWPTSSAFGPFAYGLSLSLSPT